MPRVFLIHGWEGRPDNHWFPWLALELKARGFQVHALAMPSPDHPQVSEWVAALKAAVGRPNKDTYFVGHSLGCVAIVRYLAGLPSDSPFLPPKDGSASGGKGSTPSAEEGFIRQLTDSVSQTLPPSFKKGGIRVGGCVFVAGFCSDLGIPEIGEFTSVPLDMEKAKSHCPKFVTIFSDNDKYISLERSFEFQKALGAKAILERGKGHFCKDEGVTALPSVFKSIVEMSSG